MFDNFIFKGYGASHGKYRVTNADLFRAVKENILTGFNEEIILHSKNYQTYKSEYPEVSPFDYFVSYKMGFENRFHVSPWPPTKEREKNSSTSLDLLIKAIENAIDDAGISPDEIDGWIVSTVSPHEQAPGIAATAKAYFVGPLNRSTTMTLTSGCAGFNKGIRRAIDHFISNPKANTILVAHTETMSRFLTQKNDFVSHATFGDAASAVIITRTKSEKKQGILAQVNYQDPLMIDSVGVDKDWNLYMDGIWVKNRAVENISNVIKEILSTTGLSVDDIDLLVPHQTGNVILHAVAEKFNFPLEKLYQGAQRYYGNVSGATIPIALTMLHKQGALKPGMKILCPTAGVGGEFGAFLYEVPQAIENKKVQYLPLTNTTIFILHADSLFGFTLIQRLLSLGASVFAQVNNENEWSLLLYNLSIDNNNIHIIFHSLTDLKSVDELKIAMEGKNFDVLINLFSTNQTIYSISNAETAIKESEINQQLSRIFLSNIKSLVLCLGHPIEMVDEHSSIIKEIFHGWHGLMGSMAGEAASKGIRTIWYIPAVYEKMVAYMESSLLSLCKQAFNQKNSGNLSDLSDRIARSIYCVKVANTIDHYQGPMIMRLEKSPENSCH
ncbi:MAG TPA: 3-oxoacyl-[acyl-carrier-protein] synthase III C-terminal domain-containing protein [Salinivirgaceae bacterium]|nr:3-oxoacyl-[acyl-carrier-protein] synthase III C-terminal domain-containing protein [Salinivirgaceae bacterium]